MGISPQYLRHMLDMLDALLGGTPDTDMALSSTSGTKISRRPVAPAAPSDYCR